MGTQRQIKYLSNQALNLPSGDDVAKILSVGSGFLQEFSIVSASKPDLKMILFTPQSLCALKLWGSTTFMDGTHSVIQLGRTLTTLVVRVNETDEGIIAAWFVHDSKTTSTYQFFLQVVSAATDHDWRPQFVRPATLSLLPFSIFLLIFYFSSLF